jgi:hypothetical protein
MEIILTMFAPEGLLALHVRCIFEKLAHVILVGIKFAFRFRFVVVLQIIFYEKLINQMNAFCLRN